MILGLTYVREPGDEIKPLDRGILQQLRPDVVRLVVQSETDIYETMDSAYQARVRCALVLPIERWTPAEAARVIRKLRPASSLLHAIELGSTPHAFIEPEIYLTRAAYAATTIRDVLGERVTTLLAGGRLQSLADREWLTEVKRLAAEPTVEAGLLRAAIGGIAVSAVDSGWPRLREAKAFVDAFRSDRLIVEIGWRLGASLIGLDAWRAELLARVAGRRRWMSPLSADRFSLDTWLRDAWLRAAWSQWEAVGADEIYICGHSDRFGGGAHSITWPQIAHAWRDLRLAAAPGVAGQRWSVSL